MRGFWIGVAAGFAFLVVQLAGRVVAGVPTVPELVQDQLVRLLPGPVFAFVLDRLLYLGKPSLFAALSLGEVVLAGLGGWLLTRWPRPLALGTLAWLALGLLLWPLTGAGPFAGNPAVAIVAILSMGAFLLARVVYLRGAEEPGAAATTSAGGGTGPTRRVLLGGGVSFLVSLVLGREIVGNLPSLPPQPTTGALAAGAPTAATSAATAAAALPAAVTPADQFYEVSKNLVDPVVDGQTWHLTIAGMVDQPQSLSYADLLALPAQQVYRTLECISNEVGGDLISTGQWTGVRFSDLLDKAGVKSGASLLLFSCADGYTESMPLVKARDPSTLLAYKLDGQPLPSRHGYPARVLGTGTYGMKNPKWLTRIDLVASAPPGFWEGQGWSKTALVQTMSRIDTPKDGAVVSGPTIAVGGIAFAGARGIQRVEVSTDNGKTWQTATAKTPLGPNTWTLWDYSWHPPKPGSYSLSVRAVDGTGVVQPSAQTDTFPDGATGYETIGVQVNS